VLGCRCSKGRLSYSRRRCHCWGSLSGRIFIFVNTTILTRKVGPKEASTCIAQIPNWSPVSDLVVIDHNASLQHTKNRKVQAIDGRSEIYCASGRDQSGTITELLSGLEARVQCAAELSSGLKRIWTIGGSDGLYVVTSTASELMVIRIESNFSELAYVDPAESHLDFDLPTIELASVQRRVLQVTSSSITLVDIIRSADKGEKKLSFTLGSGQRIRSASYANERNTLALAVEDGDSYNLQMGNISSELGCVTRLLRFLQTYLTHSARYQGVGLPTQLADEPVLVYVCEIKQQLFILVATVSESLIVFTVGQSGLQMVENIGGLYLIWNVYELNSS
jgi:hypothetical protein